MFGEARIQTEHTSGTFDQMFNSQSTQFPEHPQNRLIAWTSQPGRLWP